MRSRPKILVFSIIPVLIVLALLALGYSVGRYTIVRPIQKRIHKFFENETLGRQLTKEEKQETAYAYYHPELVVDEMDNFSWAVPNLPSPFVGNGPMPGQHNNAYINSMQFRAEHEIEVPKPNGIYRIFITGGSSAYGSGAPSQDRTIAGYLNKILNAGLSSNSKVTFEVLTMANPAWASTHERIMIENTLSELEPDLVISFSGNNDVHWGERGQNVLWFRSYADEFFLKLINTAYKVSGHGDLPEIIRTNGKPVSPSIVATRLRKNVKLSTYVLALKQINYVFILQPTLAVTQKALTARERAFMAKRERDYPGHKEYFIKCYALIDSKLKKLAMANFHYINLSGLFDHMGEGEEIFIDSYHFGDKGNDLIAQTIYAHIKKNMEL